MRTIHWPRCRSLEVDPFAVVPTPVARALKFIFARLPVRSAAQVRAARVNHEKAVWRAVDPDAVFLLKLRVDSERKLGRVANLEESVRLEECPRQKESKE